MCGIVGYINRKSDLIENTHSIISMLQVQRHRGPDDSGIRVFSLRSGYSEGMSINEPLAVDGTFEGVIGFNRLSILDLTYNGHQPMVSPDNKVLLTLNGEIYNAFDYKSELQEWGYRFRSTTDTEIVLALYLKFGFEGMLSRLNGMFAIVIIDLHKKVVFITRDRFGIKPMYYILNDNTFAFSSELKSFRYIDDFEFQLNAEQLDEFLLFRNSLKGTLLRDINTLSPGYFLTYTHEKGLVNNRFFNINDYSRSSKLNCGVDNYIRNLEEWLSKSVKSQLMSDVKLGCQLSGGVDSSLVTLLANRNSEKGKFEAVSIVFRDHKFTEEEYINTVTELLGIVSHKFLLDSDYYLDNFKKATWHLEAPINHPNTIAIYKLSQRAKEYVTVLLSGEGADEIFGGYERFYEISYPFQPRRLLHEVKKNLKHPFDFFKYFNDENRAIMATAFMLPAIAQRLKKNFLPDKAVESRKSLYQSLSGSLIDRQIKYEVLTYLPDLLIRQDKMSMAHSIENRVPFLDNDLVENSFAIPEELLLLRKSPEGHNTEKYLLKRMAANTFGNDFAFREKMGFGVPIREFLLNVRFAEYLNDKILPGIKQRKLFNYELISGWLSGISKLRYDELDALWVTVSFEIWASIYLDKEYENSYT